jgi:hypothetical protein
MTWLLRGKSRSVMSVIPPRNIKPKRRVGWSVKSLKSLIRPSLLKTSQSPFHIKLQIGLAVVDVLLRGQI